MEQKYFCNKNNNILQHQQIHESYAELLEPILIPSLVTLVVNKLHPRFDEATKLSYYWGKAVALIMVHCQLPIMNVHGHKYLV